jgi:hypothetical protein
MDIAYPRIKLRVTCQTFLDTRHADKDQSNPSGIEDGAELFQAGDPKSVRLPTTTSVVGSPMTFCAAAYLWLTWAYVGLSFGSALDQSWVVNASGTCASSRTRIASSSLSSSRRNDRPERSSKTRSQVYTGSVGAENFPYFVPHPAKNSENLLFTFL